MYLLTGLLLAYAFGCYWFAKGYLSPKRELAGEPPKPLVEHTFELGDQNLPSWSTPGVKAGSVKSGVVFLLVHGYGASRNAFVQEATDLAKAGYDVVVPALPGHDANLESTTGFGMKESDRILALIRAIRSDAKKPIKVVALGQSMGGATVWMAVQKDAKAFDAVVSDGAFADLNEAAAKWLSREMPGGAVILRPVITVAAVMAGVDPGKVRPMDAAKSWKGKPALVIHGQADDLIVRSHADRIAAACGAKVWEVKGAKHVEGYGAARTEYLSRLKKLAASVSQPSK